MNTVTRWSVSSVLFLLALLFLAKGFDLWTSKSSYDGDGIGIQFLFFEIKDQVPSESISSYAVGFFMLALVTMVASIVILSKSFKLAKQAE